MAAQYVKRWKPLIDRKTKKTALSKMGGASVSAPVKYSHDQYVSSKVSERVYRALYNGNGDITQFTKEAGVC